MNLKRANDLRLAAQDTLALLTRIQQIMLPIKLASLSMHHTDVKAIYELTRDAAAPLRNALANLTLEQVDPELAKRAKYGATVLPSCSCHGSFHDETCPCRVG